MNPLTAPFVFVLWTDAVTRHGWVEAEEDEASGVEEVWSSGHMILRNKEEVRLVSDVGVDGSRNRRISIPLGMVHRIHSESMAGPTLYERRSRAKVSARKTQAKPVAASPVADGAGEAE